MEKGIAKALQIRKQVAKEYGVTEKELIGDQRSNILTAARWDAYSRIADQTILNFTEIGKLFNRDRTTITHGINKFDNEN